MSVPDGKMFTFEVQVIARTVEQAEAVLAKRLAGPKVLGDPNDPATQPFAYIIGDVTLVQR